MKYVGYVLFGAIFLIVPLVPVTRELFVESWRLAPAVTALVTVAYLYLVLLSAALEVFPQRVNDRPGLYDSHLKMVCRVMVALGLVGALLGLVDVLDGIALAQGGDILDISARMGRLLEAVAASLRPMNYAFITLILGIGVSAYSLMAGTFVSGAFTEEARVARIRAVARLRSERDKRTSHSILQRMQLIEEEVAKIRGQAMDQEITPFTILNAMVQHNERQEQKNQLMIDNIAELNRQYVNLAGALSGLSKGMETFSHQDDRYSQHLRRIEEALRNSNDRLSAMALSVGEVRDFAMDALPSLKRQDSG